MKIGIASRDAAAYGTALSHILGAGLVPAAEGERPSVVLCYGGDGTFLGAERLHPGVPKLLVKNSRIGNKCENTSLDDALTALREKRFAIEIHPKLSAVVDGREFVGVNDVVLRNKIPTSALRFELVVGNRHFIDELIGDGIVVSTPFGSSAYYYSITRQMFGCGLGIAFNNLTEPRDPIVFGDEEIVEVEITRGEAIVVADNDPDWTVARPGDRVRISKAKQVARVLRLRAGAPAEHGGSEVAVA